MKIVHKCIHNQCKLPTWGAPRTLEKNHSKCLYFVESRLNYKDTLWPLELNLNFPGYCLILWDAHLQLMRTPTPQQVAFLIGLLVSFHTSFPEYLLVQRTPLHTLLAMVLDSTSAKHQFQSRLN